MDNKREMQLKRWAAELADQQESGLSIAAWCRKNGIPNSTFECRCKQVNIELNERISNTPKAINTIHKETEIVKVELPVVENGTADDIVLFKGDIKVNIPLSANCEQVRIIMEVLANA